MNSNLVLGGEGLIGKAICNHLISLKEEVISLDLKSNQDLRCISLEQYDNIDYVWFFAWEVGGAKYLNNPNKHLEIIRNNTLICQNVFSFLEKYNKKFMFASSQLATPDNIYGVTKLLGEHWSKILNGQIIRLWNVYGWENPGEKSHVIPDLVIQGLTNKKINLMTNGKEERQFVFIDDCVKCLLNIRNSNDKITHVTNGEWIKIKDVALMVGKLLSVPVMFGSNTGYGEKIDPLPSASELQWPTSLELGIQKIIADAKNYLANK